MKIKKTASALILLVMASGSGWSQVRPSMRINFDGGPIPFPAQTTPLPAPAPLDAPGNFDGTYLPPVPTDARPLIGAAEDALANSDPRIAVVELWHVESGPAVGGGDGTLPPSPTEVRRERAGDPGVSGPANFICTTLKVEAGSDRRVVEDVFEKLSAAAKSLTAAYPFLDEIGTVEIYDSSRRLVARIAMGPKGSLKNK